MRTFFSSHPTPLSLSIPAAVAIILVVTFWRILMLGFNATDLFVDEAQYWLWGQHPDFGYYSKPPMIGWVIRLFNILGQSDATFWVRLPSPLFHMATALLLMLLAARMFGRETSAWTGVTFVTLPAVSLSSVLMSTDTIQLTFLAVAISLFVRLTRTSCAATAAGLGVALGLAFMTKYSVLFLLPGVGIAMLTIPSTRISVRDMAITAIVGAIIVAPNLWWNLTHGAATVKHTESIANWDSGGGTKIDLLDGLGFFAAQFGVVGPIVFAMMLWPIRRMVAGRSSDTEKLFVWLSLPCVALITLQAIFGSANANWAVPAYVAGTVLACSVMMTMPWWVMRTSLVIHLFVAIAIPVLTVVPFSLILPNGDLAMKRYVGRSTISQFVAETARTEKLDVIVARDRSILADIFYTLRDDGFALYAKPPAGFPDSYYEQTFPLPADMTGPVLYVATSLLTCEGKPVVPVAHWQIPEGYQKGRVLYLQKVEPDCLLPESNQSALR